MSQVESGKYHLTDERQYSAAEVKENNPLYGMAYGRSLMARLITNWTGENGWLKKMSWRNGESANEIIAPYAST